MSGSLHETVFSIVWPYNISVCEMGDPTGSFWIGNSLPGNAFLTKL